MAVAEHIVSAEARRLHDASIVIDGLTFYYDGPTERLVATDVTATNVTAAETASNFAKATEEVMVLRQDMERDDASVLIRTAADIEQAKRDGKVGIILGFQASLPVETELWRVQMYHDIGMRIVQLTYNDRCYTGDGCLVDEDAGLTRFGARFIEELAARYIALDLSHCGRRTSLEAIDASPAAPMFSHANPNAITENPRNLTDEQIRKIGERKGMIGLCAWAPLCWKNNTAHPPTVEDFVDHVDYVVDLIGVDHVGIATDSGVTDNQAWLIQHSADFNATFPAIAGEYISHHGGRAESGMPEVNTLVRITDALLRRGYSDVDTQKIIGGNFLRHFRNVWGA